MCPAILFVILTGEYCMTVQASTSSPQSTKLKIFLSYSRKDVEFTCRLADALFERGYSPDFDHATYDPAKVHTGISAEDEWWQRLQVMIAAADVMVFVVSPDSATSKVCDEEIAFARGLGKRIIAIMRRPVDFAKAPPRLSALNVGLDFSDDRDEAFGVAFNQLRASLDHDVTWYRESSRLTVLAVRWDMAGRPNDLLLSNADMRAIGTLLERRPRDAPDSSAILLGLRDKSREKLDSDDRKQRRIIGRAFVKPAEEALKNGLAGQALRLAATGALLTNDLDTGLVPELWAAGTRAMFEARIRAVLLNGQKHPVLSARYGSGGSRIVTASYSPDGSRVVTTSGNLFASGKAEHAARIWDAATGREIASLAGHEDVVWSASFSPDGMRVLTGSEDRTARLWEVATGYELGRLAGHYGSVRAASFSPDGTLIVTASVDKTARIWEAASGREIACIAGHKRAVESASFSPDSRRIVTASEDRAAYVWDAATGQEIVSLAGHCGGVRSASFSPDGTRS